MRSVTPNADPAPADGPRNPRRPGPPVPSGPCGLERMPGRGSRPGAAPGRSSASRCPAALAGQTAAPDSRPPGPSETARPACSRTARLNSVLAGGNRTRWSRRGGRLAGPGRHFVGSTTRVPALRALRKPLTWSWRRTVASARFGAVQYLAGPLATESGRMSAAGWDHQVAARPAARDQ